MLKKNLLLFSIFIFVLLTFCLPTTLSLAKRAGSLFSILRPPVFAAVDDSCRDVGSLSLDAAIRCQEQVERELSLLKNAIKPNQDKLNQLKVDVGNIIARADQIAADLKEKEELVIKGRSKIVAQKTILNAKVRAFYKKQKNFLPIFTFFMNENSVGELGRLFVYNQKVTERDKQNIVDIVLYVKDVETKKKELENENLRLTQLKTGLNSQIGELEKLLAGAKSYENVLSTTIAQLSARQQEIIAQRIGSLHLPTSLGAGPLVCTDDRNVDPGFSPAFAFFTFGIPHRVGMNQYGAKGRAESGGQTVEQILSAYFPNTELKKDYNTGITINVSGTNDYSQDINASWDIETYLKHIYEMPADWPDEALKAQAVAARSFALSYTSNGSSSICPNQQCQEVKLEENSDKWKAAVDATRGWVLTNGGNPISAWYASTAGGYTWGSGDVWCDVSTYTGSCANKPWTGRSRDTNGDVGGIGDLMSRSYDRESPCFYAAQGWRSEYGKSAWLKSEELADIVNALSLAKCDSSTTDHLYQPDKPHPYGGEVWNQDRVKQELRNRSSSCNKPFNSISDVSVAADFGQGRVTTVNVTGDAGSASFDGLEFKSYFSIRAPANISIVGPLYNVERK